ncbi:MAG: (deoxy)nucleoside triphosphate pyrophosphohydrolase [Candidatus Coprovivens sp.]
MEVVAALIEKDGKYLISRRATGDENVLGKWEFPGGKVESNEEEMTAIEREIMEEFELEVKAVKFLDNNVCEYPNKIVDLRLYECKYVSGEFKLHDHYEYKYVGKDEILEYYLCFADVPLAEYVKEAI